ncbi:MAG: HAMP domain-containing histidine kinase, partial [Campylobacterales bacterium]|nr:HAMP domain-containing histidine kinase [Campylobacterales bacterium]
VAIQIVHLFVVILPFVLLFTAISLHIKKNKLAIFYIVAQTLFLISSLIFGLLFAGVLEYNNFTRYINFVGSFSEIILFSFALGYKTRLVMKENEAQKQLVDEYSKLSFLGQTVINIYHQWKAPVNNIYNSINHIETAKEFKDRDLNNIIDENLEQIKNNTQYLRETALSYLDYYKQIDKPATKISLNKEIQSVVKLNLLETSKINLKVDISSEKEISLFTQQNLLNNLLMILFENAIDNFKIKEIEKPLIEIKTHTKQENVIIEFLDNGGGITTEPINSIFEKDHSVMSSSGIGLFLAKEFLLEKLNGDIKVENKNDGALFSIELPLS